MIVTIYKGGEKVNNILTNEEKKEIIKLNNLGKNTVEIAKVLNRHDSTIGRYLRKQGRVNNGNNSKLTKMDVKDILELYKNGMTSKEIYQLFTNKVSCEETIQVIVRKHNIARNRGNKNELIHDYFEKINSSNKAYFLGLLLTDGNVHYYKKSNRQPIVQITLQNEDRYILEHFKSEVKSKRKISDYYNGKRNESIFGICSQKMADDLAKYNIIPNKTFIINKLPTINKQFLPDLIRGIFDGDGTIYIKSYKYQQIVFGFYGTNNFLTNLLNILKEEINISQNKIFDKETVSFVTFSKKQDVQNFYRYIYYDENILYIKRKKDKFQTFFS